MNITAKVKENPNHPEGKFDPDIFASLGFTEEEEFTYKGKKHKNIHGKALRPGDEVVFGDAHTEILYRHGVYDEKSFKEKLGTIFEIAEPVAPKKKVKEPVPEGGES